MKRISVYLLVFWILVNLYPFFIHSLPAMVTLRTKLLYNSLPYMAMAVVIMILGTHYNAFKLPELLKNSKTYNTIFLAVNAIVIILFVIQLTGVQIMQSVTIGLMIAIGFFAMTRANTENAFGDFAVGIAAMFFYIGVKEIPYLTAGYHYIWTDPTIWTWQQKTIVFTNNFVFIAPMIIAFFIYKFKFSKLSILYTALWAGVFLIWMVVFNFWSIGDWVERDEQILLLYHEPINWLAYFVNKLYNVTFALILVEVIKGGINCHKITAK